MAIDELDQEVRGDLSLSFAEAPQDWTAPIDTRRLDDRDDAEAEPDASTNQAQRE
jgi:hypothetical protein